MRSNPDKNKQAVQVIFCHKNPKFPHPPLYFNQGEVPVVKEWKHLGIILDSKLDFSIDVKTFEGMYVTKFTNFMSDRTLITAILYIISMILNSPWP